MMGSTFQKLEALRDRLSAGEIDRDEFKALRRDLLEEVPAAEDVLEGEVLMPDESVVQPTQGRDTPDPPQEASESHSQVQMIVIGLAYALCPAAIAVIVGAGFLSAATLAVLGLGAAVLILWRQIAPEHEPEPAPAASQAEET